MFMTVLECVRSSSDSFRFIKWGFVSPVDQGQIPPANVLVTVDGRDGSVVLSVPSSYSGRVSGSWDRQTSPGQVTFTLSSIMIADDRVFGCHIRPVNLADSIVIDTVRLAVIGNDCNKYRSAWNVSAGSESHHKNG
ncbi:hypothetical protein ACROYT_G028483 [Oculina patagonica]